MGARTAIVMAALVAAASVSVAGCTKTDTAAGKTAAESVTVTDQWVKAAPTGMTALFGTLKNSGRGEVVVESATSPAAGMVELHEVVGEAGSTTMRPKEGGFSIPAGGTHLLVPGGDHILLMDLKQPLQVGTDVAVTLTFTDGSTLPVSAQVRDFSGAQENYQPGGHPAGHHG